MNIPSIVRLKGGLGNQLFQYSFGRWIEQNYKIKILFDARGLENSESPRDFELKYFNLFRQDPERFILSAFSLKSLPAKLASSLTFRYGNRISESKHPIQVKENSFFEGFWQNYDYVKAIYDKSAFSLISNFELDLELEQVNSSPSVAIHVRGADYLAHPSLLNLTETYYHHAMQIIDQRLHKPNYFLFTDDIDYARKVIPDKPLAVIATGSGIKDFFLMSKCHHHIIANSTFSWWASQINQHSDKIIISPEVWEKGK